MHVHLQFYAWIHAIIFIDIDEVHVWMHADRFEGADKLGR